MDKLEDIDLGSSLKEKAIKGVFWSAIRNWGNQISSFIIILLLARLLKPEDFGLVAMAGVYIALIKIFITQGMGQAIVQNKDLSPSHLDTAFWVSCILSLFLTLMSFFLAGTVAELFHEPQLTGIIKLLSLIFIFVALGSVQQAILSRKLAFKALAAVALASALSGGIVGIAMAFMGFGVWSLVGQQIVSGLAQVMGLWIASDWRPGLRLSFSHFKELFSFGVNIMGINIANFFNRRTDDLLIGYFLGPVALGYYSVGYRVLRMMTNLFTSTVSSVAFPTFSRLQDDLAKMRSAFYKATQMVSLIAFPAFLGVFALAPELVRGLFGEQWAPSVPVMQVLVFIGILHSVYYFNNSIILACGKPSWQLWITLINAVANVFAFFIAVRWGIVAVALAFVIRGYFLSPLHLWAVHKLIKIDLSIYFRQYLVPVSGSLIMAGAVLSANHFIGDLINLYLSLVVNITIGLIVFAIIAYLFAGQQTREVVKLTRLAIFPAVAKKHNHEASLFSKEEVI